VNKSTNQTRIGIVETLRGLAALSVCLFHFAHSNIQFTGTSALYPQLVKFGWVGVEAFFVLSGFIIPYSMIKSGYQVKDFFKFFAKRCLRIEPPYLLSVVLVVLLAYLSSKAPGFKGDEFKLDLGQLASHAAYLPEHLGYNWLSPVYWSLEAEFHYYILIGLSISFLWKSKWTLLIGFILGWTASFYLHLYVFSGMQFFIMGIAVAAYKTERMRLYEVYLVVLGSVAVCILRGQPLVMPSVSAAVAFLLCHSHFRTNITDFLGKISFSLYLLHVPVGGRIVNFGGRYADTGLKVWAVILIALVVSVAASYLFYLIIEAPSQRLSKKISYSRK
jgi:peptidoglycan/LPS O-acetylase OafA/YrhL